MVKCVYATPLVNRIVALVDGKAITLFELQSRVKYLMEMLDDGHQLSEQQMEQTKRQVLDQMVNDILFRQEAEKYGIEATDRDVSNRINNFLSENNLTREQFESQLQSQGLTLEEYKEQISNTIVRQGVLNMMVRRKVLVTREEIEDYYQEAVSRHQQDKKIHIKVILVPDYEEVVRIREDIDNGEISFDEAAARYSQGPNSAGGGDLGFVERKNLAPEWRSALEGVDSGDLSKPFEVRGSGAVLKLVEEKAGGSVPLSEVEDKIREHLFETKLEQRFEEYIQGLRERAVIDIRL